MLTYLTGYDFGYGWFWNDAHLYLALAIAALAGIAWKHLPRWARILSGALVLWGVASFLIVQFGFRFNLPQVLPTEHFLSEAAARPAPIQVIDLGSGSGRTTIMVARARPNTKLTALDNFSAEYIENNGAARIKANFRNAGIELNRLEVLPADMRHIPRPDASFDAAVSSYAIDHLRHDDIPVALHEVSRVLKPNGEFLVCLIAADTWLKVVYGPLLMHHMWRVKPGFWEHELNDAGMTVIEQGSQPGAKWFLCRKSPANREAQFHPAGSKPNGTQETHQQ